MGTNYKNLVAIPTNKFFSSGKWWRKWIMATGRKKRGQSKQLLQKKVVIAQTANILNPNDVVVVIGGTNDVIPHKICGWASKH